MARIFDENFDSFTAAGFASTPSAGQLDSDVWRVVGLSDTAMPAYGFTGPAGGDFGRGVITTNDPVTAGVYSPASDGAFVIQPTAAELDTNGYLEARVQNTSGAAATDFTVDFDWVARNSGARADNLTLSYSTDGTSFTAVPSAAFSSPGALAAGATFTETAVSPIDISGVSVAADGYLYLRWTHTGSTGSGSRDEVGIDNVTVDTGPAGGGTGNANVSIGDVSVTEGDSGTKVATFTVTRSDTAGAFTVHYATADGTATTADGDYAAAAGDLTFAAGGPATQTVSVTINGDAKIEPTETFAVNLSGIVNTTGTATLGTATGTGTIVNDDATITHVYDIQGSGPSSAYTGQSVTTQGVVTAISTGSSKGFYIQDVTGDGNAATSDGVFVFTGSAPTVHEGDLVNVTGTVQEYLPSGAAVGALSTTEISGVGDITTIGTHALPAAVLIGADGVHIPDADISAANAVYESLEGMLVTVETPQVVGPTNAYGEIFTVASDGADASGLNGRGDLLISGGAPVFGSTDSQGTSETGTTGDQNPERIQIDPGLGVTLPNVSTGAQLGDVTGIVGYDFGDYQVMAKTAPTVTAASPLTKDASPLMGDAGHLLVASYNAENLDPGDGQARFDTIADEIINKLNKPDVVALQEIQDNNGATDNGVSAADQTLQKIVDAVNAAGGPQYAYIDNPFIGNDTNGGEPGGNIRTAFIYRTDRVSFVAGSLATVAADGSAITSGTYTDQETNPNNPFYDSRPPLSATFTFNGQDVTVLSDHFTSKGGSAALYGSQQPPFDAGEESRAAQAQAVNTYVDGLLAVNANAKVLVAGDLNDFGFEQPLSVLKGQATVTNYNVPGTDPIDGTATYTPGGTQVLNDLQDTLPADQRFDYVYEGNAETLDHMLATDGLAAGAQFAPVHINSEFYDQTSDHDPLTGLFAIAPALTAQQTVSGQASFALAAGGTLTVATGPAILYDLAPATTGGNAAVDNAGAISATAGRGIDTTGTQNGDDHFTLLNHAGASISSIDDAVRINANLPAGIVVIDNSGTIQSTGTGGAGGQAIDFNKITDATVSTTITNEAGGIIMAADADAVRPGTNATISNAGQIIGANFNGSTGNDGVDFQDTGYGTIHNLEGGSITGARHGVTGKLPITVDNDAGATITGQLGSGINLDTLPATTTTVNNSGSITGHAAGDSDGDGIDVDGLVTIDNHGLIEATGTWSGGLSEAVTVGGGSITNETDGTIHSVQRAITIDDSNLGNAFGPTTISNAGTIQGDSGEAISITDTFADTITNTGVIVGSVALGGGDDTVNLYTGSTSGAIDGGDGTDTVNLDGGGQGSISALSNVETVNLNGGDWTVGSENFTSVNLVGTSGTLRLAASTIADGHFDGTITEFAKGDTLDLQGIGAATAATLGADNVLTVTGGANGPVTIQLDPTQDFSGVTFVASSDGQNGTTIQLAPKSQTIAFDPSSAQVTHDEGAAGTTTIYTFTVLRSADDTSGNLTFTGSVGTYGDNAADFGGTFPTTFTGIIPDGQTSATFAITVTGDDTVEGDHNFSATLTGGMTDGGIAAVPGVIDGVSNQTFAYGKIVNDDYTIHSGETVSEALNIRGDDHFVIENGGSLNNRFTWSGGNSNAVIDNDGTLKYAATLGPILVAADAGGTLTINNHVDGNVVGTLLSVAQGPHSGVATLVINNDGVINDGTATALSLGGDNITTVLNNSSTGLITASTSKSYAVFVSGNTTLNNQGQITGSRDAVAGGGLGVTVHNEAGGLIQGVRHAVTGSSAITVVNDAGGTMIGSNGSAVNIDNNADPASMVHVTNYGDMEGRSAGQADSDGDAVDVDGLVTVDNYGIIQGLGHNGYHDGEANVSEGIAIGGGVINNYAGGKVYGYGRAIEIDNSSNAASFASTTIYNEGTIQGDGHAPTGVSAADAAAFAAKIDGREAIDILGSFADTITNKGQIVGGVFTDGGDDTFNAYAGSSVTGPIDLGDGSDSVNLYTGAGAAGTLSGVVHAETLNVESGTWTLADSESYAAVNLIGGTLDVAAAFVAGSGAITFGAGAETLAIESAALDGNGHFATTVAGFGTDGDVIDLRGIGTAFSAALDRSTDILSVKDGGGQVLASLQLQGDYTGEVFSVAADGLGGTSISATADTVAPTGTASPASIVSADTITLSVLFSEAVAGLDASDFAISTDGNVTGAVSAVSGSADSYLVTLSGLAGDGNFGLSLSSTSDIADEAGNLAILGDAGHFSREVLAGGGSELDLYAADGTLTDQVTFGPDGSRGSSATITYNPDGTNTQHVTIAGAAFASEDNTYGTGGLIHQTQFDAAGNTIYDAAITYPGDGSNVQHVSMVPGAAFASEDNTYTAAGITHQTQFDAAGGILLDNAITYNPDGSNTQHVSMVPGAAFASEDNTYGTGGITHQTQFDAAGNTIYDAAIAYTADGNVQHVTIPGAPFASEDNTYGAAGLTHQTQYDAAGNVIYDDAITYTADGNVQHVVIPGASFASEDNTYGAGGLTHQTQFDAAGNTISDAAIAYNADGTNTQHVTVPGAAFASQDNTYGPGGLTQQTVAYPDGHATIQAYADGQVLVGTPGADAFTGFGSHDTFAFAAHFGNDSVAGFNPASQGGHDLIQVLSGVFANNDPLAAAQDVGADLVLHDAGPDTITLLGLHKADIASADFHFV